MIFAAPPARANTSSVDPATAIAIAARAKANFREFFMLSSPRIESGLFPGSEPSVPYSRILPHARAYLRRRNRSIPCHPLHSVHKSRTTVVSSLLDRAAADKWLHALNAVLRARK